MTFAAPHSAAQPTSPAARPEPGGPMRIESDGHSSGNPRLYELIEHAPKTGKSPTVWAWPELIDYLKVAGQPVPGPWPPHQEPRPNPEEDTLPVAVPDTADPDTGGAGSAAAAADT